MKEDTSASQDSTPAEKPSREYDEHFHVDEKYRESLPDMQNATESEIRGAHVPIIRVGSSNFKLPLKFLTQSSDVLTLEASITGTVSLDSESKGINMSRIVRSFYDFQDKVFTPEILKEILQEYQDKIGSTEAQLKVNFSYPIERPSLRSNLAGHQFYQCAFEGIRSANGVYQKIIYFDYIYSSACPCSAELSEHARETRNSYGVPHSQRSTARVKISIDPNKYISMEEVHAHCLKAIPTETQVMVKREDEQAFAELNGANLIFVEDAVRLLYEQFNNDDRIIDFEIACAHLESLHSHDAVAVISKGVPGGFAGTFSEFHDLIR